MGVHSTLAGAIAAGCLCILLVLACMGLHACQCKEPCQDAYNAFQFCIATGTCTFAGAPITHCAEDGTTPSCFPSNAAPGDTITLPIGAMWPTLGTRDDLMIDCTCATSSLRDAGEDGGTVCNGSLTVLFDGVPATGCSCAPDRPIMCSDIPHSVKVISLAFAEGASDLSLDFHDTECEANHRVCER
jgi:hypothetical protein